MGTSASNKGGTGGAWTGFKRDASFFARHGGQERVAKVLHGYVGAVGGAGGAVAAASAGVRAGQSLAGFLSASAGAAGLQGGLESTGLGDLVGADRFGVLSGLLDAFAGAGSDLEDQAARNAVLDVLDAILPEDEEMDLAGARLDEAAVLDAICRFVAALVYNLAIPVIDERLTRLQDPQLAQKRDRELREYIEALVRLRTSAVSALAVDWRGHEGHDLIEGILRAVYEQVEVVE